jgi:hypothetical protein
MSKNVSSKSAAPGSPEAWARQPFLAAIREELTGRFISNPPPLYDGDEVTLYEAIRRAAGLDPNMGLVAWENHRDLSVALSGLHKRLNWALNERLGVQGRAEPWSLHVDRTEAEIVALLEAATDDACGLPDSEIPVPIKRLLPPGMSGLGKYRGAIATQLAVLRVESEIAYGRLIDQMLSETDSGTDPVLLDWLDARCKGGTVDDGPFPANLAAVAGKWLGKNAAGTMARFFQQVASDWSDLADDQAFALLDSFDPRTPLETSQSFELLEDIT